MTTVAALYKGNDSTNLRVAFYDGAIWKYNLRINDLSGTIDPKSPHSPAAAFYKGKLYVVYKGDGNNDAFVTIYDGMEWAVDRRIKDVSNNVAEPILHDSPALAVFDNKLFLMCGGSDADSHMNYYTFDGVNWSSGERARVGKNNTGTNHAVTLAVYNDKLYTVYKGTGDDDLRWMSYDGTTWAGDQRIKDTGDKATKPRTNGSNPGLVAYEGRLYLFYKGVGNNDVFIASFDGTNWSGDTRLNWTIGDQTIAPRSSQAPRCFLWPNDTAPTSLNIVYKGESTGHLYISTLSAGLWSGNSRIVIPPGPDSEGDPQSDHPPSVGLVPLASTKGSADWMTTNNEFIGGRLLSEITLPSSHDTGMHICTPGIPLVIGQEGTSRTQEMDLYSQVVFGGARMIDIRPILYEANMAAAGYYAAHYTETINLFFGFLGQSLDSICADIQHALNTLAPSEILIINISHGCWFNHSANIVPLTAQQQADVIGQLLEACSGHLYKAGQTENVNFLTLTVNDIVGRTGTSTVIFRLTDDSYKDCGKDQMDGCFSVGCYPAASTNPSTDSEKTFFDKTKSNLVSHTETDTSIFLSWQLTWKKPFSGSLEDFAAKLNPQLGSKISEWKNDGVFTSANRPVAIGWDFIKPVNHDDGTKDTTFVALLSFNGLT